MNLVAFQNRLIEVCEACAEYYLLQDPLCHHTRSTPAAAASASPALQRYGHCDSMNAGSPVLLLESLDRIASSPGRRYLKALHSKHLGPVTDSAVEEVPDATSEALTPLGDDGDDDLHPCDDLHQGPPGSKAKRMAASASGPKRGGVDLAAPLTIKFRSSATAHSVQMAVDQLLARYESNVSTLRDSLPGDE